MVFINEVKKIVDFIANKDQSGSYTPDQFNVAVEMANKDLFNARYGLPSRYKDNSPTPEVAYEVTQKVKDDLRVFKKTASITSVTGSFSLPSDYVHQTGTMSATVTGCDDDENLGNPIDFVTDGQLGTRMVDYLTKPTVKHPIGIINSNYIGVYPISINRISLSYLSQPPKAVWAFTLDDNDNPIYDEAGSTDLEWPEILTNDIARMVLLYLGVSIRDEEIQKYAREAMIAGA